MKEKEQKRKKLPPIKTKHMIITPLGDVIFGKLSKEYEVKEKKNERIIGRITFNDYQNKDVIRQCYSFADIKDRNSYLPEATLAMAEITFAYLSDLWYYEVELAMDDAEAWTTLEKNEYTVCGYDDKGPVYVRERPKVNWTAIFMCLGIAIGISYGQALKNIAIGMCAGLTIGICIGAGLDSMNAKKRKEAAGRRKFQP